ncbi:MAG: O-antigen ligase family protein [Bacilli bacterium]|jgi:O-antigen ligase
MLPTYLIRFKILGIPFTLLEISILIVFLNWLFNNRKNLFNNLLKKRKEKENRQAYPFGWEIILILTIAFISIFVGGTTSSALGIFKAYFLEPTLLFILILNNFKNEKDIKKIIFMLALSSVMVSLMAIWQKITGQFIANDFWAQTETRRVVSFYGYPNAVALFIGPIIPLMFNEIISDFKNKIKIKTILYKLFMLFSTVSGILAIYFAKSKGALLALLLVLLLIIFIKLKTKLKLIVLSLLVIITPIIIYWQRDTINLKLSSSLSWQIRQLQWKETMEMLKDGNFFQGSGLANYQNKIKPYHQEGFFFNKDADPKFRLKVVFGEDQNYRDERWQPLEIYLYPHNIFLNFWTEIGLIGALLFSYIIIKFMIISLNFYRKEKNKRNKNLSLALFLSMLVIIIHGLVDVPYFKNDLSILFWIIISLLAIMIISKKYNLYDKNKFD